MKGKDAGVTCKIFTSQSKELGKSMKTKSETLPQEQAVVLRLQLLVHLSSPWWRIDASGKVKQASNIFVDQ